jgi:4-amino-4-deoxy-L-arabinose transferase-like glycosyltransferase
VKGIIMSGKLNNKKIEKYLFIVSMIITSLLGLILTYNFEFNNNLNLLFDSDTARVIGDASSYFYKHYRSIVHPLYILIIQPLCFILNGITMNRMISLVFISSLSTSITVLYIYKILNTIKNNPKQNLIISLIYLFSFGNIIFTSGIEVYNIAVMFIVLLWYYYIIKRNKSFDKYSYIILILLGISTAAITITNFIIFFIILGLLFITKKINIKKTIII